MDAIYLDHAATTPMRDEVREAMEPFLARTFGNPSSTHRWGREASTALESARRRVAETLGASPGEVHFVRGGTESDNMAVLGMAAAARHEGRAPRLVVSAIEHKAVLEAAGVATREGHLEILGVGSDGRLDLDALDAALARRPDLVSVMWVNNEVGTVLPVPEVAERGQAAGVPVHSDAVQAVGKIPVRVDRTPVDLLTVTAHKIYGPKGTGILFVRRGVTLPPLLYGGGQERRLRPGTEDVAGAVGFSEALVRAVEERDAEHARLAALREHLEARLKATIPDVRIHGEAGLRAPHISSLGLAVADGQALVMALDLDGIAASGGSACDSGATRASHVIEAMYGTADGMATLRFSLGRATTVDHVDAAANRTAEIVLRLRSSGVSP